MSRNISIKIENLIANIFGDPVIVCNNSDYVMWSITHNSAKEDFKQSSTKEIYVYQ